MCSIFRRAEWISSIFSFHPGGIVILVQILGHRPVWQWVCLFCAASSLIAVLPVSNRSAVRVVLTVSAPSNSEDYSELARSGMYVASEQVYSSCCGEALPKREPYNKEKRINNHKSVTVYCLRYGLAYGTYQINIILDTHRASAVDGKSGTTRAQPHAASITPRLSFIDHQMCCGRLLSHDYVAGFQPGTSETRCRGLNLESHDVQLQRLS